MIQHRPEVQSVPTWAAYPLERLLLQLITPTHVSKVLPLALAMNAKGSSLVR